MRQHPISNYIGVKLSTALLLKPDIAPKSRPIALAPSIK